LQLLWKGQEAFKVSDLIPDQTEDIEVVLISLIDIPELIRTGKIDHAIAIAAFSMYFLRTDDRG